MPGPANYLDGLKVLLQKMVELEAAVAASDWEQVLRCLEERQTLMEQTERLTPPDRPGTVGRRAAAILEDLAGRDEALRARLETALAATRQDLQQNRLARNTVSAYRRASRTVRPGMEARFVDKQR